MRWAHLPRTRPDPETRRATREINAELLTLLARLSPELVDGSPTPAIVAELKSEWLALDAAAVARAEETPVLLLTIPVCRE